MSFKRIIIIIELCVLLVLAALTAVFGFNRGVWDRSTFFIMYTDDDLRNDEGWYIPNKTYAGRASSTVRILLGAMQGKIDLCSENDEKVQLIVETSGSDSLRTVRLFSEDGVTVISDTYSLRERKWSSAYEWDHKIDDYVQNNASFKLGISDKAILDMVMGNTQTRLSVHIKAFLIGLLFLALGFAFNFITEAIIKLDKFLLGLFYDNSKNLRISEVGKDLLILPGIILFTVGVIFCTFVLLT